MDNTTKLKQFSFLHANKIQDNKHKVHCIHLCCHTLSIMMIKRGSEQYDQMYVTA